MGLYAATQRRTRHQRADHIEDMAVAVNDGKAAMKRAKALRAD